MIRELYYKYKKGNYYTRVTIDKRDGKYSNGAVHSTWDSGDGTAFHGQELYINSVLSQTETNDYEANMRAINDFYKFDGNCYQPVLLPDGRKYRNDSTQMTFKMWYVTKKDGSNWTSQDEMNETLIEDCEVYENLDDIPKEKLCIGVYYESVDGGVITSRDTYLRLPVVIKDDAKIGTTYGITQAITYWKDPIDRNVYTVTNVISDENITWPSGSVYDIASKGNTRKYVKTEYDTSGVQIAGTHAGGSAYGNTILVIGAEQSIEIAPVEKATDNKKVNYDISKNEYDVTYKIQPKLTSSYENSDVTDVSMTVDAILPAGLKYVANSSNVGEPEITYNSDGTTNLRWTLTNCEVNGVINPVYFDAHIDETSANSVQYNVTAKMLADFYKVGSTPEAKRTATTTIQIINLSSHRLYKTVETPVIERNGEIHYVVSYKNNTDEQITDFQLLDILPYNGDGRGTTFNGTYTLSKLIVTQKDSQDKLLSNDNLTISYTSDEGIRGTVKSKDINLGDGWTKATTEDINQAATGYVVKGTIQSQETLKIDIYLKTDSNKLLDKYVNSASAQIYSSTDEITTSNAVAQVISRSIEGIAWLDKNGNGIKDDDEELIKGVTMTLTDETGAQVVDITGKVVSSVKTDENGYYEFINLPMKNYIVTTSLPDNTYYLTEKGVGLNNTINSKFNVDTKSTDKITKLNSLDLPELTVSNVNVGLMKKETKVIVHYKEEDTQKTLKDDITIEGRVDDPYSTEDKIDEINNTYDNKYILVKTTGAKVSGNMTLNTLEITYWYQKKPAQVKVLHVEEGTDISNPENVKDTLYDTETINGKVDDPYSTRAKTDEINKAHKEQYKFVKSTQNTNGNMTEDTIYVIYEYKKVPSKVIVKHVDKDTNEEIYDEEIINGIVGNEYTTNDKLDEINKLNDNTYELVTPEPDNKNGTFNTDDQIVTYYYQLKKGEIEVNYLDIDTNEVLSQQIILTNKVNESYTTQDKVDEIKSNHDSSYELVKVEGNISGVYKIEKQVVTYYYKKATKGTIIVNFVDKEGNVLLPKLTTEDEVGKEYSLKAPEIDGYNVVKNEEINSKYIDGELVYYIIYDKENEIITDLNNKNEQTSQENNKSENANTGDINVTIITIISIASILGIVFIAKRNKKNE